MESAGVRYLRTSCWRIRNRRSERSERVRFLIQKQRMRKYRTKHFPCGIVFILYILRHSSFWRPFYFKSFKNAKICRYTLTDWTYHDWLTDWSDVSFFSHVKKHRSRFWLARTNLRTKIYDMAFSWVFLSMYIINPYISCVPIFTLVMLYILYTPIYPV